MTEAGDIEGRVRHLQERVRALRDIEDIKALQHHFIDLVARREWDAIPALFTHDAEVDLRTWGRRAGGADVAALFADIGQRSDYPDGYVLSSPVIRLRGHTALGEWTSHRHLCEYDRNRRIRSWGAWFEGRYVCAYTRTADGWRLSRMWFREVLPDPDPDVLRPPWSHALDVRR